MTVTDDPISLRNQRKVGRKYKTNMFQRKRVSLMGSSKTKIKKKETFITQVDDEIDQDVEVGGWSEEKNSGTLFEQAALLKEKKAYNAKKAILEKKKKAAIMHQKKSISRLGATGGKKKNEAKAPPKVEDEEKEEQQAQGDIPARRGQRAPTAVAPREGLPIRLNSPQKTSCLIHQSKTKSTLLDLRGKADEGRSFDSKKMLYIGCTRGSRYGCEKSVEKEPIKFTRGDLEMNQLTVDVWSSLRRKREDHKEAKEEETKEQEVEEDDEDEEDYKKPARYGVYGQAMVWIDTPTPKAPWEIEQEKKALESAPKKDKFDVSEVGDNGNKQMSDTGTVIDPGDDDEDDFPESKYQDDVDYRHFFLEPPPVLTLEPSLKPAMRVPREDLPDWSSRQRVDGKGYICVCFRMVGLQLHKNALHEMDVQGIKQAMIHYLTFIRFLVIKYENGLEVRSQRPLQPKDIDFYLLRKIKANRIKVGMVIGVNQRDLQRAALCLAKAASRPKAFNEIIVQFCPTLCLAHGLLCIKDRQQEEEDKEIEEEQEFPPQELEKYSVFSSNASSALWTIKVRIQNGQEIEDELLQQAKVDLAVRAREFSCANRKAQLDQQYSQELYHGALSTIANWRKVLYKALLESEYSDPHDTATHPGNQPAVPAVPAAPAASKHSGVITE